MRSEGNLLAKHGGSRGSIASGMQKTVKTGMSPGDEKSYLAEYGELWSIWGLLIHVWRSRHALDFGAWEYLCDDPPR
jgi:hypothetical protein